MIHKISRYLLTLVALLTMTTGAWAQEAQGPEVTTNTAKTEATFSMPAYDVDVDYELVRDMQDETYPVAFTGIPEAADGSLTKLVVKKNDSGKYEFLNPLTIQLIDPLAASDAQNIIAAEGITVKVLVGDDSEGPIEFDQENPISLDAFLADTKPGFYWIKAESTDENSPYSGTVYSQQMWLINGYEVTVPAGECITYFKDEALKVDDADAKIFTITAVSETEAKATATELTVAAANTPILVFNTSNADKTILIIPTQESADDVTVYSGFKGSLAAASIAASTSTQNNYAFNGKQFVWVKSAIEVGANKAWLEVPATTAAGTRAISIDFGDGTTAIGEELRVKSEESGDYYDLNGRKLATKPARKGLYIQNGKVVVIKK